MQLLAWIVLLQGEKRLEEDGTQKCLSFLTLVVLIIFLVTLHNKARRGYRQSLRRVDRGAFSGSFVWLDLFYQVSTPQLASSGHVACFVQLDLIARRGGKGKMM